MNLLHNEQSPYLLQHAANPVDWHPWGQEAFDKARRENKPVFLSIGYSTCHWCHVMAHESFEDEATARLLNGGFVSIKVDREERPDIDHIYMTAVTAMTGQGGWPLSIFLTPEARPFFGGTYFPPQAKWGTMGFKDLLQSISQAWMEKRADIDISAAGLAALLQKSASGQRREVDEAQALQIFDRAFGQLSSQFDPEYGGFGQSPKFPMGHNLSFLLRHWRRSGQAQALSIVEKTLDAMARGGICDHLGGGFHRYATDRLWHVPHFEKMLYDQALLVFAYCEAFQATGKSAYARAARETLEYVLRDLTSPAGGFYCAEDADSVSGHIDSPAVPGGHSEGQEGLFYIWSALEIEQALGEDAAVFNAYYGIKPGGNVEFDPHGEFAGKNILALTREAGPDDEQTLARARQKLFSARSRRLRPHLDDKVLTDWNGLMIAAMAFAGNVLNEPRYVQAAARAADFIFGELDRGGRLLHRWRGKEAGIEAMLEDYSFLLFGVVYLYEATFDSRCLDKARDLAARMAAGFADPKGGFFMTAKDAPGLIARPQDIYDGALPSGNSAAALALAKLHFLTGDPGYMVQARGVFERFADATAASPWAHCFLLSAMDLALFPPVEVTAQAGLERDGDIANVRKVVYKHFMPGLVFKGGPGQGPWSASVCRGAVCLPPVKDLAALERILKE